MAEVESFALDHTKVQAPYVRLAGRKPVGSGVVEKYDLRLAQPNREAIPTASLHTLEHLLAGYLRDHLEGVIDLSPMGCRTGFYLVVEGSLEEERVLVALERALRDVLLHEGPVPGAGLRECGNYRDHDLEGARAWAERVLREGLRVQPTVPLRP
ncbi:S-ribosylhomocysteine lyase [Thermus thermamylovorans]|uniref:S-ribosylhomocysteine lyase n=1 Tax=Thermus thermamylovorans TaxID=2509362 RepID=A0A4Q9B8U2_9DEIN|nr:S-ribosylhomocysteine lyase [Thermus thermamylovorans]TBH21338.1 S-ribosylhomocysteine lyase [Thermus thermamylovorans]